MLAHTSGVGRSIMKRLAALFLLVANVALAETPKVWWSDAVEKQLGAAKNNRAELEKALNGVPDVQRAGMTFLIENMPDVDLPKITAEFLLTNHKLAYQAKAAVAWGKDIPEDIFFNNVLPYANIDEKRDPWRQEFYDLAMPIVKNCKSPAEAAHKLNSEIYKKLSVKYSPQRRAPNLSPKESIAQGNASCTGLSIMLSDACRAVCIPTRLVGTPNWFDKRGNHTWVEIWDKDWHFTGACEPDPNGLNRGWFVGDAAKAQKDVFEHAIYATSFRKTKIHYPLVWAMDNKTIPGENVTDRYAKPQPKDTGKVKVYIRVLNTEKKRVVAKVTVSQQGDQQSKWEGQSRGESTDLNDLLAFDLPPNSQFTASVGDTNVSFKTTKDTKPQTIDIVINNKK